MFFELYVKLYQFTSEQLQNPEMLELLLLGGNINIFDFSNILSHYINTISSLYMKKRLKNHSKIVRNAVEYVNDNLADENLSISYVAQNVLFVSPDYLGKRFKIEMKIPFTRYVMDLRMELAKDLIAKTPDIKVYELSELTGFGRNPPYLSKVFQECFGYTPSEYKRLIQESNQ